MEETNITNDTNQPVDTLSNSPITPKPNNIYKYLLFFSLIIFFGVIISLYITNSNKNSQLSNNSSNNAIKPIPTEILEEKKIVNKTQIKVINPRISQTLPEKDWLISFVPGTVDQVLVKDPKIISYKESSNIIVSVIEFNVLNFLGKASVWAGYSEECGNNEDEDYFDNILSKFSTEDKGYIYEFKYTSEGQGRNSWLVTIIPNNIGYTNLKDFENDFMQCAAGGIRYPKLISNNYLLFQSSCGTGAMDSSGLPIGCEIAKEVIEPTLKLN
jgi:hypothetical protein